MNKKSKFLDAAQKHLQKGAYDKAIKELQKLLEEDPRDVRTLLKIGDIYAKKGDGVEATKTYRRVAEAYSEQGFFLKAVAVYKQILKHEPQNLEVALKLAELYEHLGVMQEAMVQYQIVAGILDQRGNTREWLGVLLRMVDLEPENVASRVRYAEGLSREQRNDEAIAQFIQACDLLERQGRLDDWAKVAERLVFLAPSRFDILKRLAKHYLSVGDLRRAIARLEPCFRGLPRDVETLTLLGRAFREAEHTNKAAYIYKELARVHQEEGRPAEARRAYQAVQELDPSDVDAAQALGVEASQRPSRSDVPRSVPPPPRRGSSVRATPPSTPAASPAPARRGSSAAPPRRASSVASQSSPRTPASVAARRGASTAAHPTPPGPRLSKETAKLLSEADVYVKYGLREKALDHLKKIVELDPDALDAYAKMRDLYLASRDRARAADALAYMLRIYRRRGQLDQVEELRSELAALLPGHPLARPGSDDTDFEAAPSHNDDLDSIDIDVADESADVDFGLGEPAMVASSMPSSGGHQDTSDLQLDEVSGQGEALGEYDILDELPAAGASPMPVYRGEEDDGGFDRVGTDVDGGAAEVDPDTLFEGERSPSPLDTPLSADAITGAIALASRDEPLERASQIPEAALSTPSPGDAELLSLLEGNDDEVAPEDDEADDPALEADLENVEFLLAQELHEEAREAVLDVLKRHPLHPRAIGALDRAEVALGLRDGGPRVTMEPMPDVPGARTEAMVADPDATSALAEDDALSLFDEASLSNQDPADLATMRPDTNGTVAYETAHDPRAMFDSADSNFSAGTDDFSAGATAESEEDIEAVMLADAELTRGYEYQQRGLYAEAIAAYDAATGVPSRAAQAYEMLGICLQAQGDTMGAVTAFYRALETGAPPERAPRLKYEIGMACESASDLENALAWYLSAYADDPAQPHLRARIENLGADPDQALLSQAPAMGATLEPAPAPPEPPPAEAPRPARRNKISYI